MKSNVNRHSRLRKFHLAAPLLLIGGCLAGLILPFTRRSMLWLLEENHPVEMLTFLFLMAAAGFGVQAARRRGRAGRPAESAFFWLLAVAFFVIGMEEVAWGQHLFGFNTPETFERINEQNELTLHNIGSLQGKSEWFRLLFGLGGLIGIAMNRIERFRGVAVPALLLPWFGVILLHAGVDVLDDLIDVPVRVGYAIQRSSECLEMMIGIAALLYVLAIRKENGNRVSGARV